MCDKSDNDPRTNKGNCLIKISSVDKIKTKTNQANKQERHPHIGCKFKQQFNKTYNINNTNIKITYNINKPAIKIWNNVVIRTRMKY